MHEREIVYAIMRSRIRHKVLNIELSNPNSYRNRHPRLRAVCCRMIKPEIQNDYTSHV